MGSFVRFIHWTDEAEKGFAGSKQDPFTPPTEKDPTRGLRRAGVAGSTGCPRLNARLSQKAPSMRKQVPPATPARRRPLVGLSPVGG